MTTTSLNAQQALYKGTGAGTVARTAASKFGDVVSVKDFGATGDNSTDDTTAIQAALTYAQTISGRVYFPRGTYLVSSALSLTPSFLGIRIEGENMTGVTIKATGSMAAVFSFTDVSANGGFVFSELTIDGNGLAARGIQSAQIRYMSVDRVLIKNTTTAAVDIAEGWDQNITRCFIQNNAGDGLRLGTNANNVNVTGCVISTNVGWGVRVDSGHGVNLRGNDLSANELGGIYMVRGSGTAGGGVLNVKDNYFEGNAAHAVPCTTTSGSAVLTGVSAANVAYANANIGKVITGTGIPSPATTILSATGSTITMSANATASASITAYITIGVTLSATFMATDILINGSSDPTLLSNAFPVSVSNIEGNNTTSYAAAQFVTEDPGVAQTIRIVGNSRLVYSTRSQNLFAAVGAGGIPGGFTIEGNQGFASNSGLGRKTLHDRVILTPNGGTVSINLATIGEEFTITPSSATAFTIAFPTNIIGNNNHPSYQYITIRIVNALGGGTALGAITWASGYKLAAWTNPADGFSRTITFSVDSFTTSSAVEVSRTPADVPN